MSDPKLNTPSSSEMQIDNLQSNDFSLLELFFKADAVVMLVMLSLIFLSIWCWAIIFNKYFKFKNEVKTRDNFEQYFSTSEIDHSALEKFIKNIRVIFLAKKSRFLVGVSPNIARIRLILVKKGYFSF